MRDRNRHRHGDKHGMRNAAERRRCASLAASVSSPHPHGLPHQPVRADGEVIIGATKMARPIDVAVGVQHGVDRPDSSMPSRQIPPTIAPPTTPAPPIINAAMKARLRSARRCRN